MFNTYRFYMKDGEEWDVEMSSEEFAAKLSEIQGSVSLVEVEEGLWIDPCSICAISLTEEDDDDDDGLEDEGDIQDDTEAVSNTTEQEGLSA